MIIGIQGGLGSGKTVLMTRYLVKDYQMGRHIVANYGLNIIDFDKLNVKSLLDNETDLHDVSVGIDEFTVFADCRRAMSNTIITYFILQTRKRNVCLYFTSGYNIIMRYLFIMFSTKYTQLPSKKSQNQQENTSNFQFYPHSSK